MFVQFGGRFRETIYFEFRVLDGRNAYDERSSLTKSIKGFPHGLFYKRKYSDNIILFFLKHLCVDVYYNISTYEPITKYIGYTTGYISAAGRISEYLTVSKMY